MKTVKSPIALAAFKKMREDRIIILDVLRNQRPLKELSDQGIKLIKI